MAQDNIIKALGLVTQYNPLSINEGALFQADDCVISRENVIQNRRGYNTYNTTSVPASAPSQMMTYNTRVLAHHGTSIAYDDGSGTFVDYTGTYTAPTSFKMRSQEAVSNLYITTSSGVKALQNLTGTQARKTGVYRPLDGAYALSTVGTMLTQYDEAAYRCVFVRTDANGNKIVSAPSGRLYVYNSSATTYNPTITFYLPSEIGSEISAGTAAAGDYLLQVYRTDVVVNTGAPSADTAGDEMQLVYQVTVATADVTAGYISFTDTLVDALKGANLYTNASQEGISQENSQPPLCRDLCLFKSQFMLFANVTGKHRMYITFIKADGTLNTKTITIGGVTYTATTGAENSSTGTFKVYNTGITATDIADTARSLVRVINAYASNTTIYSFYTSGTSDTPGVILLEERSIGGAGFGFHVLDATTAAYFSPTPPTSAPTSGQFYSSADSQVNYIYYSKTGQMEAVPNLNYLAVGPKNKAILRIIALRDSVIIFSEAGVYRLTGDSPSSFQVSPLDLTTTLKARNSVTTVQNVALAMTNQGVVAVTDTGVTVISRDIESTIAPYVTYSNLDTYAYGIGYESEKSYLLSIPSTSSDTANQQVFVYNLFTKTWVRWTYAISCGVIENSADKLYFSKPSDAAIYRERKSFTSDDFTDLAETITVTAISGLNITFTTDGTVPLEGWAMYQASSGTSTTIPIQSVVSSGGSTYVATMVETIPAAWSTGTATLYTSISLVIQWADWTAQQPGLLKRIQQIEIFTDSIGSNSTTSALTAGFRSDKDSAEDEVEIESSGSAWGSMPWGTSPWGGVSEGFSYVTYVPQRKVYSRLFMLRAKHNRALEKCSIAGCSIKYDIVSEKVSR